jgi:DNA-binding protein HU-beta
MNKSELISKIAEDTGLSKVSAAAAVDSFIEGITKSLKKGQAITFVGFGTFKTGAAQGAHRAQSSDGRGDQDSKAPGRPFQRRQGAQDGAQLGSARHQ